MIFHNSFTIFAFKFTDLTRCCRSIQSKKIKYYGIVKIGLLIFVTLRNKLKKINDTIESNKLDKKNDIEHSEIGKDDKNDDDDYSYDYDFDGMNIEGSGTSSTPSTTIKVC